MTDAGKTPDPMCPENFRVERAPGKVMYIRNDVTDAQLQTLLSHPGEPIKTSPKAKVRRVGHWVVKESAGSLPVAAARNTLQREKRRNAWLAALRLRAHRVRVPEPLAFIEHSRLGVVTATVHVFQYLDGYRDVEQHLLHLVKSGAGPDAFSAFLGHLADAVNALAEANAYHADLSGKNIFTRDGARFYFIDLDAVTLDCAYDEEKRLKNHIQLYDSFCDALGDVLLVPFLQKMLPPESDPRTWMPRVRDGQRERRMRIEAKWDKQGVRPRRIRDELPPVE